MSHLLGCMLLLVLMTGRFAAVAMRVESPMPVPWRNNDCCLSMENLMTAFNELSANMSEIRDKQAKDLEELKVNLNRSLASTSILSTQLQKLSADLLSHDERLKAHDVCPDVNENLDKLSANMSEIRDKQVKDVEELKVNLNRSLTSTAAINTQLEKHSADLMLHDERLKAHDVLLTDLYKLVQNIQSVQRKPRDCSDIQERHNVSGVYRVYPGSDNSGIEVDVYCDFKNVGQSWLVFQRRTDGSVDFDRNWTDYANGFGYLTGDFWLGNDKLSLITMNKKYKLRIELEDFTGEKRWAEYSMFSVNPASDKYRLTVAGYSGNAGDSLTAHSNKMFSTKDADNDGLSHAHCAQQFPGGWWFNDCHPVNLNGLYLGGSHQQFAKGIVWHSWIGYQSSLKATEMKITAMY